MATERSDFSAARLAEAELLLGKSEQALLQALVDLDAEHAFPDDAIHWARDKFETFKAGNREKFVSTPS
jgi:hypothetical protein